MEKTERAVWGKAHTPSDHMKIDVRSLLEVTTRAHGRAAVFEMLQTAMRAKVAPEHLEAYLARDNSLRGAYERARSASTKPDEWLRNVATCIRKIGLELVADTRYSPWDRFPRGLTVLILIGIRRVIIEEVSTTMKQKAVGARDMESLIELSNLLNNDFQTACKIELQLLPPNLSSSEADSLLGSFRRRKDLGAIIVLGSPVSNRMCDPMARAILGKQKPLALFRWAHHRPNSLLSEPIACKPAEEGIRIAGTRALDFPRTHDDEVLRRHLANKPGPFPDCGILMMDCSQRPFLILAAGHGGCGTKACVRALSAQGEISERLARPDQKLFEVIRAQRMWREDREDNSGSPTDNLDLVPPAGWSSGYKLEDEVQRNVSSGHVRLVLR